MGTHYKGDEKDVNSLNAYIKMMRAYETVNHCLSRRLAEVNLTISQFGTLEALYHLGPRNQREIGQKLLKSGGNITLVIDNLVKRGLVNRKKDESDRRAIIISLTKQGNQFIKKYFPEHLQIISNEFNVLSEEEKIEFARLCKKVGLKE